MSDEYDAFGRKKDDAGLGDLGWGSSGDPEAVPNPDPTATPARTTPTAAAADSGFSSPQEFRTAVTTSSSPHTWRPRRSPAVWIVQLLVLGGVAFGIYSVVDAGNDAVQGVRDTFGALDDFGNGNGNGNGTGTGSGDRGDDTVPQQVKARKLFTPEGLRSAVKAMEEETPGRIETFSIRRERINATIISGKQRLIVQLDADAEAPQVITKTSATVGPDTLNYEEINYAAPAKLIRAANSRVNRSDADVDYVSIQNFTGDAIWGVYYVGGSPIVQGDSQGRYLRRIS